MGSTAGVFKIAGLTDKIVLSETSNNAPALASLGDLYLAWTGTPDEYLNVSISQDMGASFVGKGIAYQGSDRAPALTTGPRVFIAWTHHDDTLLAANVRIRALSGNPEWLGRSRDRSRRAGVSTSTRAPGCGAPRSAP